MSAARRLSGNVIWTSLLAETFRGAILLSVVGCAASSGHASSVASWTMYQGRPDHNAVIASRSLSARWTFNAGAKINGSMAVADDTLYVDTFKHELIAVNLTDGRVRWRSQLNNIIMSTPVVAADKVVVGTGHNGRLQGDGSMVYADDQTTAIWGRDKGDAVVAFDARNGKRIWSFETLGEDMPSPVIAGNRVVFGNGDFHAYALDLATGFQLWKQDIDGVVTMASANYDSGRVLLSHCSSGPYKCHTDSLQLADGSTQWTAPYGDEDSAPTIGDGKVFLTGFTSIGCRRGLYSSTVTGLDWLTGTELWSFRSPDCGKFNTKESNERAIAGVFTNGTFIEASGVANAVTAFASTGAVRWRFHTNARVKMSPIISADKVYFGDVNGVFYVLRASDGRLVKKREFGRPFTTSSPLLLGSTLLIAADGQVMAISPISLR